MDDNCDQSSIPRPGIARVPASLGLVTYLQDQIHARGHLVRVSRDVIARHLGHSGPRLAVGGPSEMGRSQ
jgi:hypothetical protein